MTKPVRSKTKLTKAEIKELLISEAMTLTDVLDVIVEMNGVPGILTLDTLADGVKEYIRSAIVFKST